MEKGATLTWGPGLSSDPRSGATAVGATVATATAVAAAGAPRTDHPRWWWWQRDRRTDVPLCAVGLGASLLGPTSSPLAPLGGPKQATR
jgi:hypothetical protein